MKEKATWKRGTFCTKCKYFKKSGWEYPCNACNPGFEKKKVEIPKEACDTCAFRYLPRDQEPCKECLEIARDLGNSYTKWESGKNISRPGQTPTDHKEIKDSGQRTEFETGAVRDAQGGKGRFDLLPKMTIWALAHHYEKGCQKYGDRNWEKGIPIKNFMDSAQRHLTEFELGFEDENHLIAALWNIACAYETLLRIKMGILPESLDDLPYPLRGIVLNADKLDTWGMMKK